MKTLLLFSAFVFCLLFRPVSAQQITQSMVIDGTVDYISFSEYFYPPTMGLEFSQNMTDVDNMSNLIIEGNVFPPSMAEGPFSVVFFDSNPIRVESDLLTGLQSIHEYRFFHIQDNTLFLDSMKIVNGSIFSELKISSPLVYLQFPMNPGDQIAQTESVSHYNNGVLSFESDEITFTKKYIGIVDVITEMGEYDNLHLFQTTGFESFDINIGVTTWYFYLSDNFFLPVLTYEEAFGLKEKANLIPLVISEQKQQETISLFPNPSKNIITLKNIEEGKEVKIFSMSGEFIASIVVRQNSQISVDHLSSGMYILEIDSEKRIFIKD